MLVEKPELGSQLRFAHVVHEFPFVAYLHLQPFLHKLGGLLLQLIRYGSPDDSTMPIVGIAGMRDVVELWIRAHCLDKMLLSSANFKLISILRIEIDNRDGRLCWQYGYVLILGRLRIDYGRFLKPEQRLTSHMWIQKQ